MRLSALAYIGNEEDIVEAFVRHTCTFVESMIIVSTETDSTFTILECLKNEGLPLTLYRHTPDYHDQHVILSSLLSAAGHDHDWILTLDADEFLNGNVRGALQHCSPDKPYSFPWRTYVPTTMDDASEVIIPCRIQKRRDVESPQFSKIIIPSSLADHVRITQGNHAVINVQTGTRMEGQIIDDVFIAHFPVRSSDQFLHKIRNGWMNILRNPQRLANEGIHWKHLYERYGHLRQIDEETLMQIALQYASSPDVIPGLVHDPIDCAITLRYAAALSHAA